MKDRIRKIIESQHMTQQEFAETIKVAPATLSSIFTGRTAPSLKIVEAIKSRFPDISTDWLMFGRGAMTDYKSEEAGASFDYQTEDGSASVLDFGASPSSATESGAGRDKTSENGGGVEDDQKNGDATATSNGSPMRRDVRMQQQMSGMHLVNNCDKKERRIVEIRIFYDDQTWETLVPKK